MESENNVQLKLDISEVIDYVNSVENPLEKLRYLRQYIPLLAVYAEHESFQVEELIAQMPRKIRGEIWEIFSNEQELEGSKSDSNTSVEQKIDININTEFIAQRVKPKVTRKTMKDPFHQMKKLINKVDIKLEKRFGEPVSQRKVWYELRDNYRNYDEEEIIDVAEPEKIIWNAYTGSKKEMKYSTFKKNLSNIRTERKNQKK
jgi:hypothetical protein